MLNSCFGNEDCFNVLNVLFPRPDQQTLVVVTITLQTCIREMLSFNLGWNTGWPDRVFVIILNQSRQISR
jgi:hypothetical protein